MPRRKNLFLPLLLPALVGGTLVLSACGSGGSNNEPPRANDDQFQIPNGSKLDITPEKLLDNDSDPDGDTLKIVAVSTPKHGTLTPLPGGGYRYDNDGSNSPSDQFDYHIDDGKGGRATATATISITPGPTANDDRQETNEDTAVTIDVAANDTASGDNSITISTIDSTITITTPPAHGSATPIFGKVQYIPETDFYGEDSFSYTITANGIPSNPATVTIDVKPVNDPPVANDDSVRTDEDTSVSVRVTANDTDPDGNHTISENTVTIKTPPAHGSAAIQTDGSSTVVVYTPDTNFNGNDSFTYTVEDDEGEISNEATVTIIVNPVSDGPPVANADTATTGKNRPVNIDILANDSDPDGNQTITAVHVTNPTTGTVKINDDLSLRYTPAEGYTGSVSFSYRLQDETGNWSSAAGVEIAVVNTPPATTGNCSATRQENPLSRTLQASDPDPGETLTFRLGADGSGGNGPMNTANGGSVRITNPATGAYIYTPKPSGGGRGRDSFDYQVIDGSGATASGTETIMVDLKIMPLGDSITSGLTDVGNGGLPAVGQRTGYRKPLQDKLASYGYRFDFVGSIDHGCDAGYDFEGEGWPGYTAAQIAGIDTAPPVDTCTGQASYVSVQDELDSHPADIILLHIGTNDIATTSVSDIEAILDDIDAWESSPNGNPVTVVLARIIDQWHWKSGDGHPNNVVNSTVTTLNNAIDAMVVGRPNDDIIVVDMQSALTYPDDLGDRSRTDFHYWLHPNDNGYDKMADVWLYPLIGQGVDKITQGGNGPLLDKCD